MTWRRCRSARRRPTRAEAAGAGAGAAGGGGAGGDARPAAGGGEAADAATLTLRRRAVILMRRQAAGAEGAAGGVAAAALPPPPPPPPSRLLAPPPRTRRWWSSSTRRLRLLRPPLRPSLTQEQPWRPRLCLCRRRWCLPRRSLSPSPLWQWSSDSVFDASSAGARRFTVHAAPPFCYVQKRNVLFCCALAATRSLCLRRWQAERASGVAVRSPNQPNPSEARAAQQRLLHAVVHAEARVRRRHERGCRAAGRLRLRRGRRRARGLVRLRLARRAGARRGGRKRPVAAGGARHVQRARAAEGAARSAASRDMTGVSQRPRSRCGACAVPLRCHAPLLEVL